VLNFSPLKMNAREFVDHIRSGPDASVSHPLLFSPEHVPNPMRFQRLYPGTAI
jgi:hypothetical protein